MKRHQRWKVVRVIEVLIVFLLLLDCPFFAHAFSIRPLGTASGDRIVTFEIPWYMRSWYPGVNRRASDSFTAPVHESATNIIYGCDADGDCTGASNRFAPTAVLAGGQWNDNPPFKLAGTQSRVCKKCVDRTVKAPYYLDCWYLLFTDGEKRSAKGEFFDDKSDTVILYRVHFGDMQFLHAMASRDGEEARATRASILMWAEFTYRLAIGQLKRDVVLHQTGIPGMKKLFGSHGWTAQQLFFRDDGTFSGEQDFRDFAFGSLLHLVQDSHSPSHAERDDPPGGECSGAPQYGRPGNIRSFHSYVNQDKDKHKQGDLEAALRRASAGIKPTVTDVGKTLKRFYDERRPWEEVQPYIECLFAIEDPTAKAGPGARYALD